MERQFKRSFFIFNLMYFMCSGCDYEDFYCYYEINCAPADMDFSQISFNGYYRTDNCEDMLVTVNGDKFIPLIIKIEDEYGVDSLKRNDRFYDQITISLEITNASLVTSPDFKEMINLKTLTLSYNNLQVANLCNSAELISLENLDLSHNSIDTIKVDNNMYTYRNLRKLNMSNNILSTIKGGIFESFKFLDNLDLSYNQIDAIDYYTFEGLKSLKYLSLSHNNIIDINISLFRFSKLENLYLDNNKIETISTQNFNKLTQLRTLNLEYNQITTIQKDAFENTILLMRLNLCNNLLSDIRKDTFLSTNNLNTIDLSNNLIINLPKDLFISKNITSFSISENNLEGAISKGTFEGLQLITELDVSFQAITALEEFAFFGLAKLKTLLLNNNVIKSISYHSFNTLISLTELDISNNLIVNINCNKVDLVSLKIFLLNRNLIIQILHNDFEGLNNLRILDISQNNITKIEGGSFKNIEAIESLKISKNPMNGALLYNTFSGLHLVPDFDLSHTSLTSIQNGSFSGMVQLQELNISYSSLSKLERSAFINTGHITFMDLSFNKLTEFLVDGNDLNNLTTLYLNNNGITHISNNCFKNMKMLNKIILSHNLINKIDNASFTDLIDLNHLDLSFNHNLMFHSRVINNTRTLETLLLSGVRDITDFTLIRTVPIQKLDLSYLSVRNISMLHLNKMKHLSNLVMNNNNIAEIKSDALRNVSDLQQLDLCFNNISFIQPGTFKDNVLLLNLNLSHNALTSLNYGMFRGLISLTELDLSYNGLHDLGRDKFYDTQRLKILKVDYNKITNINEDFVSIHLELLSIGHNPLPCEKVILLKRRSSFTISSINIDESNVDNIDGIVCNVNKHKIESKIGENKLNSTINERLLSDIRDIMYKLSENRGSQMPVENGNTNELNNITIKIDKYGVDQSIQLKNIKTEMVDELSKSNSILERILKAVLGFGTIQNRYVTDRTNDITHSKDNLTYLQSNNFTGNSSKLDALVLEVSQVKQELVYLENIMSELHRKISLEKTVTTESVLEKLNTSDYGMNRGTTSGSLLFLEICVSLILVMIVRVCSFLYHFYQVKAFSTPRSLSTGHITDIDSSNL